MRPLVKMLLAGVIGAGVLTALAANETVLYKKVDKDGNVIFTDKPIPGSTPVKVNTDKNTVETPRSSFRTRQEVNDEDSEEAFQYEVLAIDSPQNDEGIRANDGNINIIAGITPQLKAEHSLQLVIDGSAYGSAQKLPYFNLTNVDRGTHTASIDVINDKTQEVIQSSQPITFHVLRASRLHNKRRN
ncbi:DUF4124 domain-containing protein [Kangiella shandongensis]|uniref:DUF4124 domain-containing protein n=1 Tax=Kangiella shandongensis TaxID=2763258 RepID=UPI001CBCC447|nr:DUF4124 domain-containing protein [Kangiella shandongensis]